MGCKNGQTVSKDRLRYTINVYQRELYEPYNELGPLNNYIECLVHRAEQENKTFPTKRTDECYIIFSFTDIR